MARAPDQAQDTRPQRSDPAGTAVKVTKSDTVDFSKGVCKGLCVGTAGTANLVFPDGSVAADFPLQSGYNPLTLRRINLGGTADDIWALYDI